MDGLIFIIGFFVAGIVIAVASITRAKRQVEKMNAAWRIAARTLDFSFEAGSLRGGPTITGTTESLPAQAASYQKQSGKSSSRYTRYTVEFPPLGIGLRLSAQAGAGGFLKIFGIQDIVIGDPTFDEAFIVSSTDPDAVRAVLTPGLKMALNQLFATYPDVVVIDDRVVIDRRGLQNDPDVVVSILRRLGSLASLFANTDASARLDALAEQRLEGTIPLDNESEFIIPSGVDERIATGEVLASYGILEIAEKVFDGLRADLPTDPDVVGWSEWAEQATIPPVSPAAPVPLADVHETFDEGGDGDAYAVAAALFGENRLSFETAAIFDERYAGRSVRWTGKLRRATVVDTYRLLRDGPFTKAVVDIALLENDLFGNTVVSAIVAFPPDAVDRLETGEEIAFSGTLVGIDALVRNLFVADATAQPGRF